MQTTETEGSIAFTGVYILEHLPNPQPPMGPTTVSPLPEPKNKPIDQLPQTGFSDYQRLLGIGMILIILSLSVLYKSFKENKYQSLKVEKEETL